MRFRDITLPLLRPIVATIVLIKMIWTFNWFDLPWLFTQGGPADATKTLAITVYQDAFRAFDFGQGAALGVVMFVMVSALAIPLIRLAERRVDA
jgi:ABC-type sugar transport system permease subunit